MYWQLRFYLLLAATLFSSGTVLGANEIELAETFISSGDCDNALPILVSAYKKSSENKKRILQNINQCAEKTLNYSLKKQSESHLLLLEPNNSELHLKYLDSLFYLTKYRDIIAHSKKNKQLRTFDDYWILLGRSLYEINNYENSASVFLTYLKEKNIKKKDEAYYWLVKNYILLEDYTSARDFALRLDEYQNIAPWLQGKAKDLLDIIEAKSKRFSMQLKVQTGYDSNIYRFNESVADLKSIVDVRTNYKLFNKRNNTLTLGLDATYQTFSKYHTEQTDFVSVRLQQNLDISENLKTGYLISYSNARVNFKDDQESFYVSNYYLYSLNNKIELQPFISYLHYTNNDLVKQYSVSFMFNLYLENSSFWLGPYYTNSDAPTPVIDSTTYVYPVVTDYSLTTRFMQQGLVFGYRTNLTENLSLLGQYSVSQIKFKPIDLSSYSITQVSDFNDRSDTFQNFKISVNYRQNDEIEYFSIFNYIKNYSKGFQGFNTSTTPSYNYDQQQVLIGLAYYLQ